MSLLGVSLMAANAWKMPVCFEGADAGTFGHGQSAFVDKR